MQTQAADRFPSHLACVSTSSPLDTLQARALQHDLQHYISGKPRFALTLTLFIESERASAEATRRPVSISPCGRAKVILFLSYIFYATDDISLFTLSDLCSRQLTGGGLKASSFG